MAVFNFPNSPTSGELYTENSNSWRWNGSYWAPVTRSVASSKTLIHLRPLDYEPPDSLPALLDTRNSRPVLEFDSTAQWSAIWTDIIPEGTNLSSGVQVNLWWSAKTITSGTAGWDVAFERMDVSSLDTNTDNFGSAQTVSDTEVPGTSGVMLKTSTTFSLNQLPSGLTGGELYRLRLRRNVATDTAVGRIGLHMLEIQTLN